jgi:hypothetical protein
MMDYITIARERLAGRINQKPLVEALAVSLPRQLGIAELVLDQLKNERSIDTAIGIQLDKVGDIVGEPRNGRDDDTYRQYIRFRVFVNISKGRPHDLSYATRFATQADDVQYIEFFPAQVVMFSDGYASNKTTPQLLQDVSPAAIFDVPMVVSFGEEPFRTSMPDMDVDDDSELAGVQLGVVTTLTHKRIMTLDGRRIRIKQNFRVYTSDTRLNGAYQA